MTKQDRSRNPSDGNFGDASQKRVYHAASESSTTLDIGQVGVSKVYDSIELDEESANLLNWLAKQQGTSCKLALKKALVTAAYIYDLTEHQGGRLLVHHKDKSVGEIVLK